MRGLSQNAARAADTARGLRGIHNYAGLVSQIARTTPLFKSQGISIQESIHLAP